MPELRRPAESPFFGIALMCAAVFCFVIMNTFVKALSPDYPVQQIIWARYFFHFLLILLLFPRRIPTLLVSRRKGLQFLRSLLVLLATLCMYTSLRYLPLADAVSIAFIAPLLVTGLSVVALRERVGARRWAAVIIGFAGRWPPATPDVSCVRLTMQCSWTHGTSQRCVEQPKSLPPQASSQSCCHSMVWPGSLPR